MYKIDDVQILDFAIEYVNEALRSLNLNHLLMQVTNNLHFYQVKIKLVSGQRALFYYLSKNEGP